MLSKEGKIMSNIFESYTYKRGYVAGYEAGRADALAGVTQPKTDETVLALPLKHVSMSARVWHCLCRAQCETVGDVARISEEDILRMHGVGTVTADKIARLLQSLGVFGTAWDLFLQEK